MGRMCNICIKCKIKDVKGTGVARHYNMCPSCYTKTYTRKNKKNKKAKKRNDGNKSSRYWTGDRFRKKKSKFRNRAMSLMGRTCMRCGASYLDGPIEIDHVLPISYYPELEFNMNNIQILCKECNTGKSNKDMTDYRADVHLMACRNYQLSPKAVNHIEKPLVTQPEKIKSILRKNVAVAVV